MVPDACGLSSATRSLFRSHRRKLHEYSGQAMSYQVLQQWAALGLGAAILPRSKVAQGGRPSLAIIDRSGCPAMVRFEARWSRHASPRAHLSVFADHLRLPVGVPEV
jgi:DNA-binding transcriptional LysR family regulator